MNHPRATILTFLILILAGTLGACHLPAPADGDCDADDLPRVFNLRPYGYAVVDTLTPVLTWGHFGGSCEPDSYRVVLSNWNTGARQEATVDAAVTAWSPSPLEPLSIYS